VLTLSSLPRDSVAIAMLEPGAAERGGGRLGRGAASLEFGGDLGGTRTRGLLRFGRRTQRSNNPWGRSASSSSSPCCLLYWLPVPPLTCGGAASRFGVD
jgi:hypothetical protein